MSASPIAGVLTVLPTPFGHGGELDLASVEVLVDHAIAEGSSGLVCFGLAGESYKLDDDERRDVLATVVATVDGRVPVIAGCESNSVEAAVRRIARTVEAGASAVMALPPSFVKPDVDTTVEYYREIAAAADGRPLVIQDAPAWTEVPLPVDLLERIRDGSPSANYVKVETPPNAAKIRRLVGLGFTCVGGFGALHLMEDHTAGISAVMPGAGMIRSHLTLWQALQRDRATAWPLFERLLPLFAFQMASLDTFVAVQKELLQRRGIIASTVVRRPGRQLDEEQRAWLEEILSRLNESFGA